MSAQFFIRRIAFIWNQNYIIFVRVLSFPSFFPIYLFIISSSVSERGKKQIRVELTWIHVEFLIICKSNSDKNLP